MKALLFNAAFTSGPVVILCFVGLVDLSWGTQLYIQMIENFIIFTGMTIVCLWEQRMQQRSYLHDKKYEPIRPAGWKEMCVLEDDMPEFSKTREQLLKQEEKHSVFVEHKFDELIKMFKGRMCKSFRGLIRDNEPDPRQVQTWPNLNEDDFEPPQEVEALPDPQPDNCFAIGLNEAQMQQMKFLSKQQPSKAIQSDAYDADYNLRKDAMLVGHHRELIEVSKSMERKKQRGRKNRYFKQIDNEDHEAGVLLDDDEEGQLSNLKAKNELLDAEASIEARRVEQTSKLMKEDTKNRANMLTEENLRLKKLLEEQRQIDAKNQEDF